MKKQLSLFFVTVFTLIFLAAVGMVSSSAAEKLPSPGNFMLNTIDDSVKITWDEVIDASKYELFYQQAGTQWQNVIVEGTAHTFTEVNPYETYYFQIRAIDENNNYGYFSAINTRQAKRSSPPL